ncbi:MAG: calcium/sodium antiporter [Clostridia bacterium]|nr:calcium/sodium antiporter [Clostridia bacterium]
MLVPVLLFCLGLVLLIKGGDWFVDGATGIAHRFHVPELLIGATVVSIGTTLPEVMVSATSALGGHSEIAYGNAIGSIICNTALISAITMAVRPCKVDQKTFRGPVIFFFAAALFYSLVAYITGSFSRIVGIVLLALFVAYILYNVRNARLHPELAEEEEDEEEGKPDFLTSLLNKVTKGNESISNFGLLVIGAALIAWGADLLVDNGTLIAQSLGVPESVIALTFVALGTSLPELVTAITSLAKGHGALSLGNIVGANIFNLVLVGGVSITLRPFNIPVAKTVAGMNASLLVEIPVMLFVMAFMTLPALKRGKLTRAQGITLLAVYAAFCVFQFVS